MACFLVPAAEAIAVTIAYAAVKKKEQKIEAPKLGEGVTSALTDNSKIKWSKKLGWLMSLLWGGVLLLAFEHFWHGEIVPFPPFLTAMYNSKDATQMLHEMMTVGVAMTATVTAVWGTMCAVADAKVKKIKASISAQKA